MRKVPGWWLVAALAGCDTPGEDCRNGGSELGARCFPDDAVVRVGYGFVPTALARADFDGDGESDVAAVSRSRQTLTITWSGGDLATSWALGEEVEGLAIGDVDGDGRMDVVTTLPASDAVAVLHGRGGREFVERRISVGDTPRAVIAAELDGDDAIEWVVANAGDGSVSVVNDGVVSPVIVGAGPHALAAGDLDGDGTSEVAVVLADDDAVQLLRGDGAGGLLIGERHSVGAGPLAVAAGDFDGDAKIDVATADALADTVTVLIGDGVGGIQEWRTFPAPTAPRALAAVGWTGRSDIAVLGEANGEVALLDVRTGEQATTVTRTTTTAISGIGGTVTFGGAGQLGYLLYGGLPGLRFAPRWQAATELVMVTAADIDGDGVADVVVRDEETGALKILGGVDGRAIGAAEVPGWSSDWSIGWSPAVEVLAGDVDGDARVDLTLVGTLGDEQPRVAIVTLLQGADGSFAAGGPADIDDDLLWALASGDVDGDGRMDVVVQTNQSVAQRWWARSDGAGRWTWQPLGGSNSTSAFVLVDFDHDERLDLVGLGLPWLVRTSDVAGAGTDDVSLVLDGNTRWVDLAAGDLDGDGEVDAVLCGSNGVGLLSRIADATDVSMVSSEECTGLVVRDVEGDGDLDLLVVSGRDTLPWVASEGPRAITWWANDGAGGFNDRSRTPLAGGYLREFVALDDDDVPDLVVQDGPLVRAYAGELGATLVELLNRPAVAAEEDGRFADLDGDGLLDRYQAMPGFAATLATGDGRFGPWFHAPADALLAGSRNMLAHAAADIDGDGAAEVVLLGYLSSSRRIVTAVRVGADGAMDVERVLELEGTADQVLTYDFEADGRSEVVVVTDRYVEFNLRVLRAVEGGFAEDASRTVPADNSWYLRRVLGLHRLDGDAWPDLVYESGFQKTLEVAWGQADGGFVAAKEWGRLILDPYGEQKVVVRDIDGDRAVDVLSTGFLGLYLQRGTADRGALGGPRLVRAGVTAATVADVDGDGPLEVVAASGELGDVTLHLGRTSDSGLVFRSRTVPMSGQGELSEVVVGRFDDDEAQDVAVVGENGMTIMRQSP